MYKQVKILSVNKLRGLENVFKPAKQATHSYRIQ